MRMQTFQLSHDDADVLRARRRLNFEYSFHRTAEGERMDVRANSADAFHEGDHLHMVAGLGELFDAAEVEADMQLRVDDGLVLADQIQLVGLFQRWMVGTHWNL